jgi:4-amino-4-deoxy-L-arabinose transferase-like glycosyltransferase
MADFVSNLIDSVFNLKKNKIYLLIIFILAFILRLIAAINLSVTADDMHHVLHAINFLGSGKLVTYDQSSGLWHLFTSLMYNIFGVGQLTSRFAPLLFGSFSVLVIYLLSREFFDEKISLFAALLLAIAPFHIKNTYGEMDVMAMFFVLMSMLFFTRALKQNKNKNFIMAGIFLGLALYTKVYPILFLPSLLIYFAIYNKMNRKKIITKQNVKQLLLFLVVAFIFAIPVITHNYSLYKDKGFMDLQFSRTFGLGEEKASQYYSWDPIWGKKNSWTGLIFGDKNHIASGIPLLLGVFNFIRKGDPIVFYLAILSIILIFYKRREKLDYVYFFLINIFFVTIFLGSIILLPKHFIYLEILMIPLAAYILNEVNLKLTSKYGKIVPKILIALLIIISLLIISLPSSGLQSFYGKSGVAQVIDFKKESISKDSLMVMDGRIYTGTGYWMATDRPNLDGPTFINLMNQQEKIEGRNVNVDIYFVECVIDDCGWGLDKVTGQLNDSMEILTTFFNEKGNLVKEIKEPNTNGAYNPILSIGEKREIYKIYKVKAQIKEPIFQLAKQPKKWFLYEIGYSGEQFDDYYATTFLPQVLNSIAKLITRIALVLAILSMILVIYLILKR